MKTGLTLGKYAPFHKGHEYVISIALKEMDHVIVIVYNASDVTDIPTKIRAKWIQNIFPTVETIIAEDGPQDTGYTSEIIEKQNNFLKKLLQGRIIDSFYSSENYGNHVSNVLNCRNRVIDIERNNIQISATIIRETKNIKLIKNFVSKCVYNTLKPKYYFIGAPSTGKTTISQICADILHGSYCFEYGREYWFKFQKDHKLSMNDLECIAIEHTKLEDKTSETDADILFIDTSVLTTYSYALYYFNNASDLLTDILIKSLYKYKHLFLCNDDIPFDDTWDRSGPRSRTVLQKINKTVLEQYGLKYVLLSGTLDERIEFVKKYSKERFGDDYF
jgi:NadR type nicotinamide-nucleotide adenylyltransferase